nr:cytochrome P450 [Paracoccus saliphilus]
MQSLREKYGSGPLLLRIPFRHQAVILSPDDARMILEGSPEPFTAATREKRSALGHFQPDGVLSSQGRGRAIRRALNEQTLETGCPVHTMSEHFATVADEEMAEISRTALASRTLDWGSFFIGWYRMVRRIVLGDAARDDSDLTDLQENLRYRSNYAFLRPKDRRAREEFLGRVRSYVDLADPRSLAGRMGQACTDPRQQPHHQLPQYLFAFDPAGMASFRTLAMLSAHPHIRDDVRQEIREAAAETAPQLELLRACFLDVLRLWPTTPVILRETTQTIAWRGGQLKKATQTLIITPFLHRDEMRLPQAHRFDPELWRRGNERPDLGLLPFSHGPVICPAFRFVPIIATLAMRSLLSRVRLVLNEDQRLTPDRLPGTLDNYTLSFSATDSRRT